MNKKKKSSDSGDLEMLEIICEKKPPFKRLRKIQKKAFDPIYLEMCGYAFKKKELYKGSSYLLAQEESKVIGYLMYQTPEDPAHEIFMNAYEEYLEWRYKYENFGNISEIVRYCEHHSGLDFDESTIDTFDSSVELDENDSHLLEIAVHPNHQGKGVSSALIRKFHELSTGKKYLSTRNTIKMHDVAVHMGYEPFFQFGPLHKDNSLLVLFVNEK